jgi:hypothetical protein
MRISTIGCHVQILKQKFHHSLGLPFRKVLPERLFEEALEAEAIRYRDRLFSPMVTVWAFLSQILDQDNTCANAVSRVIAWLASEDQPLPSPDPSAYCQARKRLPETLFRRLLPITGDRLEKQVGEESLWHGHRVWVVDGSTTLLPDTPANQKVYPQHPNQAPGCGFPIARFVGLFSLQTGAAQDVEIGSWSTHELHLTRPLHVHFQPGDVAMGDSLFCTYADIALLQQAGIEGVFHMHGARSVDFRRGQRLGKYDHLVEWHKPRRCPSGMDPQVFAQLPDTLLMREIRVTVTRKGFRSKNITVATTLTDPVAYPKEELADLFRQRWEVELYLRHIKTTLGMERLTTQTPEMARKELLCHLLAYNLIRSLMWEAGEQYGVDPKRLSLQDALRHLRHFLPQLAHAPTRKRRRLYEQLLYTVARKVIPQRADRKEPRVRKQRPKPFPLMKKPRAVLRRKCAA